jgi:hypothetical protein
MTTHAESGGSDEGRPTTANRVAIVSAGMAGGATARPANSLAASTGSGEDPGRIED